MSGGVALADDDDARPPRPDASISGGAAPVASSDGIASSWAKPPLSAAALAAAAAPIDSAAKVRAKNLVLEATDAALAANSTLAEALFSEAWSIEKTYDIAANLGHMELQNGKPVEAAEHLRFALEALPPSETEAHRARIQQRFNEARSQIGAIAINVSIDGAEVLVDGRVVGTSPLAAEVLVAPGSHQIAARKDGFRAAEDSVSVNKGAAADASLALSPLPELPAVGLAPLPTSMSPITLSPTAFAAPTPHAASQPDAKTGLRVGWFVAGGAVTVVSAVVGVSLHMASVGHATNAEGMRADLDRKNGPEACYDDVAYSKECNDLEAATNSGLATSIGSKVAFGLGGAAVVGSVAYLIFGRTSRAPRKATTVLPAVTGNAGGLLVTSVW